mmetsp:Transcript_19009/g.47755  ORF Transcript_19009/g.47755 Transcript_19009/m.47755 type:complete len:163 (-) Transcript_19009:2727-3215(-)
MPSSGDFSSIVLSWSPSSLSNPFPLKPGGAPKKLEARARKSENPAAFYARFAPYIVEEVRAIAWEALQEARRKQLRFQPAKISPPVGSNFYSSSRMSQNERVVTVLGDLVCDGDDSDFGRMDVLVLLPPPYRRFECTSDHVCFGSCDACVGGRAAALERQNQ